MKWLLALILLVPVDARTLMDKMGSLKSASPTVHRVYLHSKLRHVSQKYLAWLQSVSDNEFIAHLRISYFGSMLVGELSHRSEEPTVSAIRDTYYDLVSAQFEKMRETITAYSQSTTYNAAIYEQVRPYIEAYKTEFSHMTEGRIPLEEFQRREQEITRQLMLSELNPLAREMLQILVFLEFQVMEYGLS